MHHKSTNLLRNLGRKFNWSFLTSQRTLDVYSDLKARGKQKSTKYNKKEKVKIQIQAYIECLKEK